MTNVIAVTFAERVFLSFGTSHPSVTGGLLSEATGLDLKSCSTFEALREGIRQHGGNAYRAFFWHARELADWMLLTLFITENTPSIEEAVWIIPLGIHDGRQSGTGWRVLFEARRSTEHLNGIRLASSRVLLSLIREPANTPGYHVTFDGILAAACLLLSGTRLEGEALWEARLRVDSAPSLNPRALENAVPVLDAQELEEAAPPPSALQAVDEA